MKNDGLNHRLLWAIAVVVGRCLSGPSGNGHCQKTPREANGTVFCVPRAFHAVGRVPASSGSVRHRSTALLRKKSHAAGKPSEFTARLVPAVASAMLFRPNDGRMTRKTRLEADVMHCFALEIRAFPTDEAVTIPQSSPWAAAEKTRQLTGSTASLTTGQRRLGTIVPASGKTERSEIDRISPMRGPRQSPPIVPSRAVAGSPRFNPSGAAVGV
jgi:hypothetical protein